MTQTSDKYLPIEDLANHLSVTVSTIRGWVRKGHIPPDCYLKVGKRTYRFNIPAVVEALKHSNQSEFYGFDVEEPSTQQEPVTINAAPYEPD
jgi:excisionase family DNA binding protein|tara:strand:+ start:285 stop:560 length:276 start_codon:yes stop_codon:yes gene_type:complete